MFITATSKINPREFKQKRHSLPDIQASLVAQTVKNLPAMQERPGFDPWVGKIPWRRARQPTLVFFPREFHGQRSLAGCSPWDCKELDVTEVT